MKLEVGKFYRTRDGRKAGPVLEGYMGNDSSWPFRADIGGATRHFTCDGFLLSSGSPGLLDLVAPWEEESDLMRGSEATVSDERIVEEFNRLVKEGRVQVEAGGNEWTSNSLSTYRLEPARRSMRLPGSGYEVVDAVDGPLQIGCVKVESREQFRSALRGLCKQNAESGYTLDPIYSTRKGVLHERTGETITWNDADTLLKFLEEGSK